MQPLLTAIVLRRRGGPRLGRVTLVSIAAALVGVLLVISRGHPSTFVDGSIGWGIALVVIAQVGWAIYTVESVSFRGWSPLRFTALTAVPGMLVVLAVSLLADAVGLAHPSVQALSDSRWTLGYVVLFPTIVAVLAWNAGRARIGAQNVALFMNLVPVTTFAIETVRGYRPDAFELVGAALTIGALAASNLHQRHTRAAAVQRAPAAAQASAVEAAAA